eukprot:GHVP01066216.1.p1 GENE.GHVP01066216.1~~GHVP01066216.1.p1  ORF type:complete len:223 (+),score=42.98 GHVP01066216.1:26-670(+)
MENELTKFAEIFVSGANPSFGFEDLTPQEVIDFRMLRGQASKLGASQKLSTSTGVQAVQQPKPASEIPAYANIAEIKPTATASTVLTACQLSSILPEKPQDLVEYLRNPRFLQANTRSQPKATENSDPVTNLLEIVEELCPSIAAQRLGDLISAIEDQWVKADFKGLKLFKTQKDKLKPKLEVWCARWFGNWFVVAMKKGSSLTGEECETSVAE